MARPEPREYSAADLERIARDFLTRHYGDDVPVSIDVDLLLERIEGVDLDYWPELRANHGIEGGV